MACFHLPLSIFLLALATHPIFGPPAFLLLFLSVAHPALGNQDDFNYEIIDEGTRLGTTSSSIPVAYSATFTNLWTKDRHPRFFPINSAHWSPIVYASHIESTPDTYQMWCDDCLATDGIELIAETGGTGRLRNELRLKQNTGLVLDYTQGPGNGAGSGEETSPNDTFCVDENHSFLSAISMIAPSPDWFSGMYNLPLQENGKWYDKISIYTYAWDAGTEGGNRYSLSNSATDPKVGMRPFRPENANQVFVSGNQDTDRLQVLPVAMITLELQGQNSECTTMSQSSVVTGGQEDAVARFHVQVRKGGVKRVKEVNCRRWVRKKFGSTKRTKRCNKKTRDSAGNLHVPIIRVGDLCPVSCMNK